MVIAAAVMVVVVVIMLARGCGRSAEQAAGDFLARDVLVVSPDLEVELISVGGTAHPGYTDWSCLLECRESAGCRAGVELVVDYVSAGEKRRLLFSGALDAEKGETMRLGRPQRPATVVDKVEKITLEVISAYRPGAPRPTPMM